MIGPVTSAPSPPGAAGDPAPSNIDETAESLPDTTALAADEFSKNVEVALVEAQTRQQLAQLQLDRMKQQFNDDQQEHAKSISR